MRDYNAIQFRSPSEKQKQGIVNSHGLINATRSASLSPIPAHQRKAVVVFPNTASATGSHTKNEGGNNNGIGTVKDIRMPVLQQSVSNNETINDVPDNTTSTNTKTQQQTTVMSLSPTPPGYITKPNNNNTALSQRNQLNNTKSNTQTVIQQVPVIQSNNASNGVVGNSNSSVASNTSISLSPSDALALRRDYSNNTDLYINKLRNDIVQQQNMIQKMSSNTSKSDAIILELRSTIRQYKRQLDKLQQQQESASATVAPTGEDNTQRNAQGGSVVGAAVSDVDIMNHPMMIDITQQLMDAQSKLQTADLIRKELEDTIEAEQYTWELRVQDLEREVNDLKTVNVQLTQQQQSNSTTIPRSTIINTPDSGNNEKASEAVTVGDTDEYRKQLQDAQNEIQRYRNIIMTTTTTSSMDNDDGIIINNNNLDDNNIDSNNILIWKEKVMLLEQERLELQGCLDEALKELEAVDLELQQEDTTATLREENERLQQMLQQVQQQQQQSGTASNRGLVVGDINNTHSDHAAIVEQLQHLYRWILERDIVDDKSTNDNVEVRMRMNQWNQYDTVDELIHAIQQHIETYSTTIDQLHEVEQQISVYKGDLHAKEEEINEVRNNLKEAVSLLRPIQDQVSKLEKESAKYQELSATLRGQHELSIAEVRKLKQLVNEKDDEIDQMRQNIESLEIELSKAKLAVASTVAAQHNVGNTPQSASTSRSVMDINEISSPSDVLDEKRAKRRTGENNLKELLRGAHLRDVASDEQQMKSIQSYEHEISVLRDELAKNDLSMQKLQTELQLAKDEVKLLQQQTKAGTNDHTTDMALEQAEQRVRVVEQELQETKRSLASKRDAERSLNKSLKDALGLIKPLQIHLEESEAEKRQIAQELEALKQQQLHNLGSRGNNINPSSKSVSVEVVKELETTVRQLEKENAKLHDALEDMSQSLNASHISIGNSPSHISSNAPMASFGSAGGTVVGDKRLHQDFVELKSRYEVTHTRLKDAYDENQTLSELIQQEQDEKYMLHHEVTALREQLLLQQQHQKQSGIATPNKVPLT